MKSILSILIVSLFVVSNTMAVGVSLLPEQNYSYTVPLLQDDNGDVTYFEAFITGTTFKELQPSDDSFENEEPCFETELKHGSGVFLAKYIPSFHQTRLYRTLFPFHSFL